MTIKNDCTTVSPHRPAGTTADSLQPELVWPNQMKRRPASVLGVGRTTPGVEKDIFT